MHVYSIVSTVNGQGQKICNRSISSPKYPNKPHRPHILPFHWYHRPLFLNVGRTQVSPITPSAVWLRGGYIPPLKNVQLKPVLTHRKLWHFHFHENMSCRGIQPQPKSGLGTTLSQKRSVSSNSIPSFFNHDQKKISCFIHGSIIVNYHNADAEEIPFIWQKIERNLT